MTTMTNPAPDTFTTGSAERRATADRAARRWRHARRALGAVAALAAIALPALTGPYLITLAATAIVLALLAMSTQLLAVAGLPSFGQTTYLGIGAYTAALLAAAGITNGPALLAAAAGTAALAAAVLAPFVLRTRGVTFLMVTVMIQGLAVAVAVHWTSVTGGDEGRHTPAVTLWPGDPLTSTPVIYWYTLTAFAAVGVGTAWLMRSRLVLLLRAHAGHEPRMTALGHRATLELGAGYAAAAAISGAGGALLITINTYVSPADISFGVAAAGFAAAALGTALAGFPTMTGALVAAVAIVVVRDWAGSDGTGPLLLGLLLLTVPYLRPAVLRLRARRVNRPGAAA
ncbi:hypothetical protein GCM10010172_31020 [Paractinoplanes ferrugineus]|uniref:Amino acid/amide ABC transporter membrane protein 2 (HAAT family) n=1 Tax=Paractinoplanes ferrugineus TaxID=113564 RepID=A0A919MC10_9ACTN|nr:branched-chain amino acid ABC transporter permease [Actinoplanes ferrugineus]GIE14206.1 hypothetical protein Afe05nite_60460 [Actinoplanes ferrugineus]